MNPYCVSFYTKYARPHTRTEDFMFIFFCLKEKNYHCHINAIGNKPFISLVCNRVESLKKIFYIQQTTWVIKKETFTKNEDLQGHFQHFHTYIAFVEILRITNWNRFFRSIDKFVHSLNDILPYQKITSIYTNTSNDLPSL